MGGPKALMQVGGRVWWRIQEERLGAAGVAPVNMVSDADGQIRRVPIRIRLNNESLPGLDAQMHALVSYVRAHVYKGASSGG